MTEQFIAVQEKDKVVIKKPKSQQKAGDYALKPHEVKKIIYSASTFRDRCMIKTLAYTGCRRNELRNIRIEDIDWQRARLHVVAGAKFGKTRDIPLPNDLLSDLRHLIGARNRGVLFESPRGETLTNAQINNIIAKTAEKAGITSPDPRKRHVNPHLFRHSFARNAKASGMRLDYVQYLLGHQSYKKTADIYGTPGIEEISQDYENKIGGMYS